MKLTQFQDYLKKEQIELAILVHPDINITYFTQIKPTYAILMIAPQKTILYLTSLDKKPSLKQIQVKTIKKNWEEKVKDEQIRKIGINEDAITVADLKKFKKLFPKAKFVDVSDKLKELRAEKTSQEIAKITAACRITDNAFSALIEELAKEKFTTEQEVAQFIENKIKEQGAELAFPTIVATGRNAAVPHHVTSGKKLKRGFLLLDFGANYKNYCADLSRTIFLGTPTKEEVKMYKMLLNVQEETITKIKNNLKFSELDLFSRKQLGRYSSHFIHSLGHGLGLEIHEQPAFLDKKQQIKQNQVFTIEPGIYFPNKYGLRIEDTILLGKTTEILTKSSKELVKVKIGPQTF